MNNRDKKSKEHARQVSDMLNVYGFDLDGFCKHMSNEHRTIQQSFTRLCLAWIETCADENYRFDGRNEASHLVASKIVEILNESAFPWEHLPFV